MLRYLQDQDFNLKLLFPVPFFSFTEGLVPLANYHNYKEILVLMKPHGKIPTAVLLFRRTTK